MKHRFIAGALIVMVSGCFLANFITTDTNAALVPEKGRVKEDNLSNEEKCGVTFREYLSEENSMLTIADQDVTPKSGLLVPSKDQVKDSGFPKNKNGETYGSDIKEFTCGPDLILAMNDEGVMGDIRQSDMDDGINTPEEASKKEAKSYEINMYLEDGETCIGTFKIQ